MSLSAMAATASVYSIVNVAYLRLLSQTKANRVLVGAALVSFKMRKSQGAEIVVQL